MENPFPGFHFHTTYDFAQISPCERHHQYMDLSMLEHLKNAIEIIQSGYPVFAQQWGYIRDLQENVNTLVREDETLQREVTTFKTISRKRQRLSYDLHQWLDQADICEKEVRSIRSEYDASSSSSRYSWSGYKLGRRVAKRLKDVQTLKSSLVFRDIIANSLPRVLVMGVETKMYGKETTFKEIDRCLKDGNNGIICLYGPGGIGKTTLMKTINNKLVGTVDFDIVIWVTVSQDFNAERIREAIMKRLGCDFKREENKTMVGRDVLFDRLSNVKYLLIFDDLWEGMNLDDIGIPKPGGGKGQSKIVITTREHKVCSAMLAHVIEIKTVADEDAWTLFSEKTGPVVNQLGIQSIAKDVVMACDGHPQVITTVGKAMRNKNKPELWQNALRALKGPTHDIEGMEQVFSSLKRSYDNLEDDNTKMCFLLCSFFPKDCGIGIDELVEYMIMEGFVDNVDNLGEAKVKGYGIVERIKCASLLKEEFRGGKCIIKIHDGLTRGMAAWITSSSSSPSSSSSSSTSSNHQGPKCMVKAGVGLKQPPQEGLWRDIEWISLMKNEISNIPFSPECNNLVSLYMRENSYLSAIHNNFFRHMPNLRLLDLSDTLIESLTDSLTSLVNLRALKLRNCSKLKKVPLLGQMKELKFLDLSYSAINELPHDMGNLVKLIKLNLSHMRDLRTIPCNVISRLSGIEDLCIIETFLDWANEATLVEVGTLPCLTALKITIQTIDCVAQDVLQWQWSNLETFEISIGSEYVRRNGLDCGKMVHVYGGGNYAEGVKVMLMHGECLVLEETDVKSVSQLVGNSESLRTIFVEKSNEMKYFMNWNEVGHHALENIEELHLIELSKLKKLFHGQVPQGSLRKLRKIVFSRCDILECLFSSDVLEHLTQLKDIQVSDCAALKEIIQVEILLPNAALPGLRSLNLSNLPRLTSIITSHTLALPSSIEFSSELCPNLTLPQCLYGR